MVSSNRLRDSPGTHFQKKFFLICSWKMCHARRIQASWRAHRCRVLLSKSRALPDDLWSHICTYIREQDAESRLQRYILRLISLRVLRMRFSTPRVAQQSFPSTSRMVRAYLHELPRRTVCHMSACAIRIIESRHRPRTDSALHCANVFLEYVADHRDCKARRVRIRGCARNIELVSKRV